MTQEIVFVHLGKKIPKFLDLNLALTRNRFPASKVTLITDVKVNRSDVLNISNYEQTMSTRNLFSNSTHDENFRSGFWLKSLERLIAVFEYQIANKVENLIHIESDVLLLPNFPLESLRDLPKPVWTQYSSLKSVGAVVCIPSPTDAANLLNSAMNLIKLHPGITDMTLLNMLAKSEKIANTFSHQIIYTNRNFGDPEVNGGSYTFNDGFFDPAQIGMWLTGEDPRNHLGMNVIHSNSLYNSGDSDINPEQLLYSIDSKGNLWAKNSFGIRFPIWSLHIHSKNKKLFGKNAQSELNKFVLKSDNSRVIRKLDIKVLLYLVMSNLRNGTLMAYTKNAVQYLSNLKSE